MNNTWRLPLVPTKTASINYAVSLLTPEVQGSIQSGTSVGLDNDGRIAGVVKGYTCTSKIKILIHIRNPYPFNAPIRRIATENDALKSRARDSIIRYVGWSVRSLVAVSFLGVSVVLGRL